MGKPVDTRVVEYAYLDSMNMRFNTQSQKPGHKYAHHITLNYVLKDTDKVFLSTKSTEHILLVDGENMEVVDMATKRIYGALKVFVPADKHTLSGYQQPTQTQEA